MFCVCLAFEMVSGKVEKRSGALSTRNTTPPAVPIIAHQPRDSAILSIQNVKRKKEKEKRYSTAVIALKYVPWICVIYTISQLLYRPLPACSFQAIFSINQHTPSLAARTAITTNRSREIRSGVIEHLVVERARLQPHRLDARLLRLLEQLQAHRRRGHQGKRCLFGFRQGCRRRRCRVLLGR
jgi:hypothetical protein